MHASVLAYTYTYMHKNTDSWQNKIYHKLQNPKFHITKICLKTPIFFSERRATENSPLSLAMYLNDSFLPLLHYTSSHSIIKPYLQGHRWFPVLCCAG